MTQAPAEERHRRAAELQRSVVELQRSVVELQRSVVELQRSVVELQRSVVELQRSVVELQRWVVELRRSEVELRRSEVELRSVRCELNWRDCGDRRRLRDRWRYRPLAEHRRRRTATAKNNAACVSIKPFYWEIGDQSAAIASDSLTPDGGLLADGGTGYQADTQMLIASASKWLYSSYFVQKTNGVLSSEDIQFFNFWSGYTDLTSCAGTGTVGNCLLKVNTDGTTNGMLETANVNFFFYSGGHEQKHAALNGLSAMANAVLATEIRSQLGTEINLTYTEPQLAGGGKTSAADYAKVLRKILSGQLVMKTLLGTNAVCTNPHTCALAKSSPLAEGGRDLSYHYSIGHWVEDDPSVGDGAFSSPGSFGSTRGSTRRRRSTAWIARQGDSGSGFDSVACGLVMRKAWTTGVEQ